MKNKFLFTFIVIILTTSCGSSNDDINITTYYYPNKSYADFESGVEGGYFIDNAALEKLQAVVLRDSNYASIKDIQKDNAADVSGWFVSKVGGREYKTQFYVFIFEYGGPNGSLDALTFYFDSKKGLLISISCPKNNSFECTPLEYPLNRGAMISFG